MIGQIRCVWAGKTIVVELGDDLQWSCGDPLHGAEVSRWLQVLFDPQENRSPSRGAPGYQSLQDAAIWLEGTVEALADPELNQGDGDPYAIY